MAWTATVIVNDTRGGILPRVVQVRFAEAAKGWSFVYTRDDLPAATTLAQINAWTASHCTLLDKLTAAYDDAQTRIGQAVTQGNWTATLRARRGQFNPPQVILTLDVTNAVLGVSRRLEYTIDRPADYTLANLTAWIRAYLTKVNSDVATAMIAPTAQEALERVS